ncbi:hypothetical protein A2159_00850 [Candidatus Woesebacteria bacterium RBG_13_34_9]|uniref:Isopentenyl phosphate kinase n=1 Tax=Candidatus Woesebacteria bacterium RBG_13_34_9 TaxID=1802477 RepID=A0A1F7X587_9BACT|nr:MAG: hypothetical protein A2159_00850 [Candidatus Woesebacteria bacterium RBG_13_34_9]
MKSLILVKLGGSLITDKKRPFSVRFKTLKSLCREIYLIRKKTGLSFIVGHGGGSFPHVPAQKYRIQEGLINKDSIRGIAEVQDAASRLNRIVVAEFLKVNEKAISFNPSSFFITRDGEIKKAFLNSLLKSLELGMLPIVYGDVTFDEKKGCNILSTERLLNYLALALRNKYKSVKVIYCGITDGVYDEEKKTVKEITPVNFEKIKEKIRGSEGIDVTGGMLHKVKEALKLSKKGIPVVVINGLRINELKNVIEGKSFRGTYIKNTNL